MRYITASNSVKGLRKINQDRYCEFSFKNVKTMIICDGNGGDGGEVIADCAMKALRGEVLYRLSLLKQISMKKLQFIGQKSINRTVGCINNLKLLCPKFSSCGTTLTLVLIYKSTVITFWIGDSPAMVHKGDRVIKLTDPPHTLAEMLIAQGEPRESIEKQSSLSSTLTRCIGFDNTEPSTSIMTFKPPFTVIVASDGIDYIPEDNLKDIFDEIHLTECLPDKIIIAGLEHGSSDNITVVVTKVKAKLKIRSRKIRQKNRGGIKYVE